MTYPNVHSTHSTPSTLIWYSRTNMYEIQQGDSVCSLLFGLAIPQHCTNLK